MTLSFHRRLLLGAALALPLGCGSAWGQSGITQEGDHTVFRSGGGDPLLTLEVPFVLPMSDRLPVLEFEFGFATDEQPLPGSFFDSFSVTLQPVELSDTALLLTADITGVVVAPYNPGGLPVSVEAIDLQSVTFPELSPALGLRSAYTVSYTLPLPLTDGPATLFFDFFDNQNLLESLAYVRDVRITALPSVTPPANIRVWSARSAEGPYREEKRFVLDADLQVIRVIPEGDQGFFVLLSELRARPVQLRADADDWILNYVFDPVVLELESADAAEGPYEPHAASVVDLAAQTFRLPLPAEPRFFRVRSDLPASLTVLEEGPESLVLHYAFPDTPVALLGADSCTGPYLPETAARNDGELREIRVQRGGSVRFLKLTADQPVRITRISNDGSAVLLEYETQ